MTRKALSDTDTTLPSRTTSAGFAAEEADEDRRAAITARRNVLLGLWAAKHLGLPADEQDALAWSVHFADMTEPGHEDVIRALALAFADHGVTVSDSVLRDQLHDMTLRAEIELSREAGDA